MRLAVLFAVFAALATATALPTTSRLKVNFLIDSSLGVQLDGYRTEKALVMDLSEMLPPNSVVEIINVGSTEVTLPESSLPLAFRAIQELPYPFSPMFDLPKALLKASKSQNRTTTNVIVIITPQDIDCIAPHSHDANSCQIISRIQSTGTMVISVGLRFAALPSWPRQFFGDSCLNLRTDADLLPRFAGLIESALDGSRPNDTRKLECSDGIRSLVRELPSLTTKADEPNTHVDRLETVNTPCSSNYAGLWMDILVLVDSSAGVTLEGFVSIKSILLNLIEDLSIGQRGKVTRLALINVGSEAEVVSDLQTFHSNEEASDAIMKLQRRGDNELNAFAGMKRALEISRSHGRANAQQLFVLFSSKDIYCPINHDKHNPCQIAADLRARGVLMTVALSYAGTGVPLLQSIATECYDLQNSLSFESDFKERALQANCRCKSSTWTQLREGCLSFGTCVYEVAVASSWTHAARTCQMQEASLPVLRNEISQILLQKAMTASIATVQWIGLRTDDSGVAKWVDGSLFFPRDYNHLQQPYNLAPNQFTGIRTGETPGAWLTYNGTTSLNAFLCQQKSCDADSFCE